MPYFLVSFYCVFPFHFLFCTQCFCHLVIYQPHGYCSHQIYVLWRYHFLLSLHDERNYHLLHFLVTLLILLLEIEVKILVCLVCLLFYYFPAFEHLVFNWFPFFLDVDLHRVLLLDGYTMTIFQNWYWPFSIWLFMSWNDRKRMMVWVHFYQSQNLMVCTFLLQERWFCFEKWNSLYLSMVQ